MNAIALLSGWGSGGGGGGGGLHNNHDGSRKRRRTSSPYATEAAQDAQAPHRQQQQRATTQPHAIPDDGGDRDARGDSHSHSQPAADHARPTSQVTDTDTPTPSSAVEEFPARPADHDPASSNTSQQPQPRQPRASTRDGSDGEDVVDRPTLTPPPPLLNLKPPEAEYYEDLEQQTYREGEDRTYRVPTSSSAPADTSEQDSTAAYPSPPPTPPPIASAALEEADGEDDTFLGSDTAVASASSSWSRSRDSAAAPPSSASTDELQRTRNARNSQIIARSSPIRYLTRLYILVRRFLALFGIHITPPPPAYTAIDNRPTVALALAPDGTTPPSQPLLAPPFINLPDSPPSYADAVQDADPRPDTRNGTTATSLPDRPGPRRGWRIPGLYSPTRSSTSVNAPHSLSVPSSSSSPHQDSRTTTPDGSSSESSTITSILRDGSRPPSPSLVAGGDADSARPSSPFPPPGTGPAPAVATEKTHLLSRLVRRVDSSLLSSTKKASAASEKPTGEPGPVTGRVDEKGGGIRVAKHPSVAQIALSKPKLLVLDLDETLIHSTSRMGSVGSSGGAGGSGGSTPVTSSVERATWNANTAGLKVRVVEVVLDGRSVIYHVYKRPWVDFFLKKVSWRDDDSVACLQKGQLVGAAGTRVLSARHRCERTARLREWSLSAAG